MRIFCQCFFWEIRVLIHSATTFAAHAPRVAAHQQHKPDGAAQSYATYHLRNSIDNLTFSAYRYIIRFVIRKVRNPQPIKGREAEPLT